MPKETRRFSKIFQNFSKICKVLYSKEVNKHHPIAPSHCNTIDQCTKLRIKKTRLVFSGTALKKSGIYGRFISLLNLSTRIPQCVDCGDLHGLYSGTREAIS